MANVSLKIGKHKSRTGGLTKAGREKYNRETGANLKALSTNGFTIANIIFSWVKVIE